MKCLAIILATATGAFAHGGGLDASGGHFNRSTGSYHYHRGGSSGLSVYTPSTSRTVRRRANPQGERWTKDAARRAVLDRHRANAGKPSPAVRIVTAFPDAEAKTVEQSLTMRIERLLGEVDGVRRVASKSAKGESIVIVLIAERHDPKEVEKRIVAVVNGIEFPAGVESPVIDGVEVVEHGGSNNGCSEERAAGYLKIAKSFLRRGKRADAGKWFQRVIEECPFSAAAAEAITLLEAGRE